MLLVGRTARKDPMTMRKKRKGGQIVANLQSKIIEVPRESLATSPWGVLLARSNTVGTMTAATARASRLVAVCATVVLKYCSCLLRPPKRKHMP